MEIKNGTVDSYWIKKHESGIVQLMINTTDKWVEYHQYTRNEYGIGTSREDVYDDAYKLIIPKEELDVESNYISTELQNKDRLSFYFIPYNLLDMKIF